MFANDDNFVISSDQNCTNISDIIFKTIFLNDSILIMKIVNQIVWVLSINWHLL